MVEFVWHDRLLMEFEDDNDPLLYKEAPDDFTTKPLQKYVLACKNKVASL
jgi:hypothetical protein